MPYFLIAFLLFAPVVQAQAWTQARGAGYAKLAYGHTAARTQFTADGRAVPYDPRVSGPAFWDRSVYLYAEYGVWKGLTVVGMVPYKRLTVVRPGASAFEETQVDEAAFGTAQAGVRLDATPLLGRLGGAWAVNVGAQVPLGYARNAVPAVGAGQVDVQATLAAGGSLYPLPAYAQAAVGVRLRTAAFGLSQTIACPDADSPTADCLLADAAAPEFSDELLYSAEVGYTLGTRLRLQAQVHGVYAFEAPAEDVGLLVPGAVAQQRYTKAGLGATLLLHPRVGVGAQVFTTPAGQRTLRSTDWFVGVEVTW